MRSPSVTIRATKPLRLKPDEWRRIEPLEKGIRLYITPEFAIEFCSMSNVSGDTFYPPIYLDAVDDFENQVTIQVSGDRIQNALSNDSEKSVFFHYSDVDPLIKKFEEMKYVPHLVKVYYEGQHITPQELPDTYHGVFLDYALEYDFEYCAPFGENKDVFETIHASYAIKEKKLSRLSKQEMFGMPLRKKDIRNGAARTAFFLSVTAFGVAAGMLLTRVGPSIGLKIAGALLIGVSEVGSAFFRQQAAVIAEHAYNNPILKETGEIFYD